MVVLLRSVTSRKNILKLGQIIFLWLAFLGFYSQSGKAIESETSYLRYLPSETNSPEVTLRGIEFDMDTPVVGGSGEEYGYQIDDSVPFSWKDPTGATPVELSAADDGFAGPIALGFDFPFYENVYSELYVSSNGYISFSTIKGNAVAGAKNQQIPNEFIPNNLIAPFWNDLAVGGTFNSGIVSTISGDDENGQYFAINYVDVSKKDTPTDLLTFQVLLYENGNVWFQYNSLSGDTTASVGIEDGDGLSGLEYSSILLLDGLAVRFQRPGDEARIKLMSTLQSGLTESGIHDFILNIRNTGELGADTYNLTNVEQLDGSSDWAVTLMDANGETLTDTNGDQIMDTGLVSQGETISIIFRLQSLTSAVGDHVSFNLTATSVLDPGKSDDVQFLTANPSKHFIAFGNSAGLDLGRTTPDRQIIFDVTQFGDSPSLIFAGNQYFYTWQDDDFIPGKDIEYAVLDYNGTAITTTKLTSNEFAPYQTFDSSPVLAVSPNGRVGLVWIRQLIDTVNLRENFNVFMAILDTQGHVLVPPFNVSNNGPCDDDPDICWQDGDNLNVPKYSFPGIIATSDNRFIVSSLESYILEDGPVTDIDFAIYTTEGEELIENGDIKNGNAGAEQFEGPRFVELANDRILVAYTVTDPITSEISPAFSVYSSLDGDEEQAQVLLTGVNGRNLDIALLTDSKILMAWPDTTSQRTQFTILTDEGEVVSYDNQLIRDLPAPDHRNGENISVAATENGLGILSWLDIEVGDRVYYALVNANADIITPTMIAWEGLEPYVISQTGQGIVTIPDWYVRLPLIYNP